LGNSIADVAQSARNGRAITIQDLVFSYTRGKPVLDIPELSVTKGERVFLFGPSGSGKTTLLGLLAGVLQADSGSVSVLGSRMDALSGPDRDEFRAVHIGYIFQMFNLIPYLSVLDNILLPCRLSAKRRQRLGGAPLEQAGEEVARQLGIGALLQESVTSLSVGQQQRVAAARALQKDWVTTRVLKVEEIELGTEQRPLQAELDSFLRAVRDGSEPEVTGLDGRRALALADRIAADIRSQRW
jgi:ABC-type lipoprotein export system ATPase subunit